MANDKIQLFEDKAIRTAWDSEHEEWYFSIVDVVRVLTDSSDATAYWRKLKQRLKEEGNETVTNCHSLKWTGTSTEEHKHLKGLTKENLRDNMSNLELILTMLAEETTTQISKATEPSTLQENKQVVHARGDVAKNAREDIGRKTGQPVITRKNAKELNQIVTHIIESVGDNEKDGML